MHLRRKVFFVKLNLALRTLERQVKRLEQKDDIEAELRQLSEQYYGFAWKKLDQGMKAVEASLGTSQDKRTRLGEEIKKLEQDLAGMEKKSESAGFSELRKKLDALSSERTTLERKKLDVEKRAVIEEAKSSQDWAPMPLSKIITTVGSIQKKHSELLTLVKSETADLKKIRLLVEELSELSDGFSKALERPAPEKKEKKQDEKLVAEIKSISEEISKISEGMKLVQKEIDEWSEGEKGERKRIFSLQHEMNKKREALASVEREASKVEVEKAKLETRRDTLLEEVERFHSDLKAKLDSLAEKGKRTAD